MPVVLQLLFEHLRLAVADLNRADGVVRLLEPDRTVPNVLTCGRRQKKVSGRRSIRSLPSISFQAFRKSSGSEKAMKPYLAFQRK